MSNSKAGQSHQQRAEAAARLATEKLFPLAELRGMAGASVQGLRRWAIEGRFGLFLDVVRHPEKGWLSSAEAVQRFLRAVAQRKLANRASAEGSGK